MSDPAPPVVVPEGLDEARHLRLDGRGAHPAVRRLALTVLGVFAILALANVFGQRPQTSRAGAAFATLEVQSPAHLRGGLIFQTRITVRARSRIAHPLLTLQRGWFESMSVNSIVPDPVSQTSDDGDLRMTLAPIAAGHSASVWIYFQVNPTNVARRSEDVTLADGSQRLVVHRSVTVFP
jgi:hypothetical protein